VLSVAAMGQEFDRLIGVDGCWRCGWQMQEAVWVI
jgi:hypothetical protein